MIGGSSDSILTTAAVQLVWIGLVKATVVLLLAWAGALLLRNRSAAMRSAVWAVALSALLALPVLSSVLPSWEIDYPGSRATVSSAGFAATTVPADRTVSPPVPQSGSRPFGAEVVARAEDRPSIALVMAALAFMVWLGGAVMMLLRLALHGIRVCGIARSAEREVPRRLEQVLGGRGARAPTGAPMRVVISGEVSIPFSCGMWKPTVVLPATARNWPLDRLRSVLLHEQAHVARQDYRVHVVVEIVRALYWPNPLVWIAARRVAMERERACDDFVLHRGTPSDEYATHLLHLARAQLAAGTTSAIVTMADASGLKERLRSIMSPRADRTPVRADRQVLAACLALAVVVPLSMAEIRGADREIPSTEQLVGALQHDDDPRVRQRSAWWLGEHEDFDAVWALVDALRDESAAVRQTAAWALGEIKDRKSIPGLVELLEDGDPLVREMAALALGEIEHPSAIRPLVRALDERDELRPAVAWALGEIRGDEAEEARARALEKCDPRLEDCGMVWTETPEKPSYLGTVGDLFDDLGAADVRTRRRAALGLGHVGMHHGFDSNREAITAVDRLLRTLRDPAPEVRAAAVWSLDEINPSRSADSRNSRGLHGGVR
jgi:beta-lactamase regulating signal transducer with metallopeptidase domain/HEAT repeat protein